MILQLSIHLLMHLNIFTLQYIYRSIYLPIYSTWERGRLVEASIEEWIDFLNVWDSIDSRLIGESRLNQARPDELYHYFYPPTGISIYSSLSINFIIIIIIIMKVKDTSWVMIVVVVVFMIMIRLWWWRCSNDKDDNDECGDNESGGGGDDDDDDDDDENNVQMQQHYSMLSSSSHSILSHNNCLRRSQ